MQQVTIVALDLRLVRTEQATPEAVTHDPLMKEQLQFCGEILTQYGATITGQLGHQLVAMFGYHGASEADAPLAMRTVLELSESIRRRSDELSQSCGMSLQYRIGMHTGPVMVGPGHTPTGITLSTAISLATSAPANTTLLVSALTF